MASSPNRHSHSLIPSFLYSSSFTSKPLNLHKMAAHSTSPAAKGGFMIPAPNEPRRIELYSLQFYAACAVGGILGSGLSHMAVIPLERVSRNLLTDPGKYKSISAGFGTLLKEQGAKGLMRGSYRNLRGFGVLGANNYGFYEAYKKCYFDMAGPAQLNPAISVLGAATSVAATEFAFRNFSGSTGTNNGLHPFWAARYTLIQFAVFEFSVWGFYMMTPPKKEYSKPLQLGVSFSAGFLAGAISAIFSTPPDAIKNLGQWGLRTGGVPFRMVMVGTLAGAQWCIYDAVKLSHGLPTTGACYAPAGTETANALLEHI